MKKIFLLTLLVLNLPMAEAQLLWKISGNGLSHPSYIFGTHPLIPISFLDSVPGLYKAFNASKVVVGETIMSNVDARSKIQSAAIMPNHIKITDLLSKQEYALVDTEIKQALKLNLNEIGIMHPALITTLYEMEVYKKATAYTDDVQSDSYFQLVATEKEKKVIGLETTEQQIENLFGNKSLEHYADLLLASVQNKDSVLAEMKLLNDLYRLGKIDELVQRATSTLRFSKNNLSDKNVLDKRNADWVRKLPSYFKESSCFVSVSAIQLGGENGLIKKLQQLGYKVKPVY